MNDKGYIALETHFAEIKKLTDRLVVLEAGTKLQSEVEPILVLSTAHLGECLVTPHGAAYMDEHSAMTGEAGWLMWTGGDNEPLFLQKAYKGLKGAEALNSLSDILKAAREQKCSYVMFDRDGEKLAQFPTYNW